ncbi:hypothetical protein ACN28S_23975 [Cystobacter fuscus]
MYRPITPAPTRTASSCLSSDASKSLTDALRHLDATRVAMAEAICEHSTGLTALFPVRVRAAADHLLGVQQAAVAALETSTGASAGTDPAPFWCFGLTRVVEDAEVLRLALEDTAAQGSSVVMANWHLLTEAQARVHLRTLVHELREALAQLEGFHNAALRINYVAGDVWPSPGVDAMRVAAERADTALFAAHLLLPDGHTSKALSEVAAGLRLWSLALEELGGTRSAVQHPTLSRSVAQAIGESCLWLLVVRAALAKAELAHAGAAEGSS